MSCHQEWPFECRNFWASTRQRARRLDICGDGGSVRKFNRATSVVNLDSSEVTQEKLLSVLGAKRALESPAKSNQLTQFVETNLNTVGCLPTDRSQCSYRLQILSHLTINSLGDISTEVDTTNLNCL
jgi:hypothetical protein